MPFCVNVNTIVLCRDLRHRGRQKRFLTDKCGYIRWETPAREAVHVPAQGFSIHYLTFFDRLFFQLPRIVMPSSSSFPPTLIGEEPQKQSAILRGAHLTLAKKRRSNSNYIGALLYRDLIVSRHAHAKQDTAIIERII